MKKTLLLLATTAIWGASFQAQAFILRDYVSVKGGYAAMKHQSMEKYRDNTKPLENDWNGDAGMGSVAYGLKAGYLRVEAEGNATSATRKKRQFLSTVYSDVNTTTNISTLSAMFNAYLELPVEFPLRPYIGAGVGMAHIRARFKTLADDNVKSARANGNHFAWQVGAGIAYDITPYWTVDVGYRFLNYGNIVKKITDYSASGLNNKLGDLRVDAKVYNAYVGVRYTF